MPIKLSSRVLLTSDADAVPPLVSVDDEDGVIIEGENNKDVNPFLRDEEWISVLDTFGTARAWAMPEEGDVRFSCFAREPSSMRRPEWLKAFMSYGRKLRFDFKIRASWRKQQSLLKLIVSRFFVESKAQQTRRSVFRACIVLGLFLICDNSKDGTMTNMVLHLARSCSPPARRATLDPKPVRVSRPATKSDLRKIIKNQETLFLMWHKNTSEIAKLAQNRKGTRTNPISDQEAEEVFEIVHLSDDSEAASDSEDDVEDGEGQKVISQARKRISEENDEEEDEHYEDAEVSPGFKRRRVIREEDEEEEEEQEEVEEEEDRVWRRQRSD
jgi:hypothetical protein